MSNTENSTPAAPTTPEGAAKWLDLLKKANDYNLIPIILAIAIGYAYWTSQAQWTQRLDQSEARTRAALERCTSETRAEHRKTREELAKEADAVKREIKNEKTESKQPVQ